MHALLLLVVALALIVAAVPRTVPCGPGRHVAYRPSAGGVRIALAALVISAAFVCTPPAYADEGEGQQDTQATLTAYFFDVGQGDSELVVLPGGETLLIDAGTSDAVQGLVDDIEWLGFDRIDYLVATHPHEDHIGGMPEVFDAFEVGEVWAPEVAHDTQAFEEFLDSVEDEGLSINAAVAGSRVYEGNGCTVDILSPSQGASYDDLNDWSAVVRVAYGSTSMLFTGDASAAVLEPLSVGHVDVLKVPHHGSDTGTTPSLLSQLTPSVAVIEVGAGNSYGHPTQETVDELAAAGVHVWRTDQDGSVYAVSDGTSVSVMSTSGSVQSSTEIAAQEAAAQAAAAQAAAEQEAARIAAEQAAAAQAADPSSQTVYITNTGEKYHRDGCRYLKSRIETTLGAAVAQGYEPCKVCNPPTL